MITEKKFVDLDNARVEQQKKVMEQIVTDKSCPFCKENLHKYHKEPLLKNGTFWILTKNQWPYENTSVHILAIYKKHAENLADIDPAAGEELFALFQWAEKEYTVPGGAFAMRFGDTEYSAGTVNHIHAQFIQPNLTSASYEPVRFKIGKNHSK